MKSFNFRLSFLDVLLGYSCIMYLSIMLAIGCGSNPVEPIEPDEPIKFAVIGDRTGSHEWGFFKKIVNKALTNNPDFLIDCGDMIEGGTENWAVLDLQWTIYKFLISDVDVDFLHTPGNHDLWFEGQIWQYIQHIGTPYYSKNYDNLHIIVLDNSRWTPDSLNYLDDRQMQWLEKDLKNNDKEYTFVFCHKPYWDKNVKIDELVNDSLHLLFLKNGVDGVFAGHYHNHFATEYDDILYTIVGRSGGGSVLGHPAFTPKDIRYRVPEFEHHSFYEVEISDGIININYNQLECK